MPERKSKKHLTGSCEHITGQADPLVTHTSGSVRVAVLTQRDDDEKNASIILYAALGAADRVKNTCPILGEGGIDALRSRTIQGTSFRRSPREDDRTTGRRDRRALRPHSGRNLPTSCPHPRVRRPERLGGGLQLLRPLAELASRTRPGSRSREGSGGARSRRTACHE